MRFQETLKQNYSRWKEKEYLYEKINGQYVSVTYGTFLEKSCRLISYMKEQGLSGKKVMLYGENSGRLMMADLALLTSVGVSVWVTKEWRYQEIANAVDFLGVSAVIYSPKKCEEIEKIQKEHPELLCISTDSFDEIWGTYDGNTVQMWTPIRPENECCKIVFTSGTTASSKAVMLSERNLFAGVEPLYKRCSFDETDVDYLFLPLNHTYGGIYNFLYSLVFGFSVYLCSDISNMATEILEVKPTLFCGVPIVFRKFYEGYGTQIKKAFGPRINYLFCGGADSDSMLRSIYKESGLNLMEAYALSETASTFAIQYPHDADTITVGTVAENLDVKILTPDEDGCGEIVVKGDAVFLGYANQPELTAKAFTPEGYFKTGDLGFLQPDKKNGGYKLYLKGRIKKQLIGENGENIETEPIERLILQENPNINRVFLYLKEEKLACRLHLKEEEERDWQKFFDKINRNCPQFARIQHYEIRIDAKEGKLYQ